MPEIGDTRPSAKKSVFIPKLGRKCYNHKGKPKMAYSSKSEAKQALKSMTHRNHLGIPMQRNAKVYRCDECRHFHIGHN